VHLFGKIRDRLNTAGVFFNRNLNILGSDFHKFSSKVCC